MRRIADRVARSLINEAWKDDRFEYDHLSDEGNGGIEEYGMNIANLIGGLGKDSDSLHAVGEEVAQFIINGDDADREIVLKPFIEGLIAGYKSGPNFMNPSPQDIYDQHGIVRN